MSEQEIRRSISKFNQYISEHNRFLIGSQNYIAKGYKAHPLNEGYADVKHEETPELIEAQNELRSTNVSNSQSPFNLEEASQGRTR